MATKPAGVVGILNAIVKKGATDGDLKEKLKQVGLASRYMATPRFTAFWDEADPRIKKLVELAKQQQLFVEERGVRGMAEEERDYIGYGGNPPKVEWPGGARIALNLVLNWEEGSELGSLEGDPVRETLGETAYPLKPNERDLANEEIYQFGSRAGVWRIMRILDKYGCTCTVNASAMALERNPVATKAFLDHGYDTVGHGYRWTSHYGMTEQEEREDIRRARDTIERITGKRPIGWITRPPQTIATRRLLKQEGFLYDSGFWGDDLPCFQQVDGQPFLLVPYSLDLNDMRFWRGTVHTANDFFEYMRASFDILYEEGATHPRMMSVGIHCRVSGRPGRAEAFDRFLAHVRKFPDVWVAQRNDIASFWLERYG